jgi:hypothetical protein
MGWSRLIDARLRPPAWARPPAPTPTVGVALALAALAAAGALSGCSTPALHPNGVVKLPNTARSARAPSRVVAVATVRGPAAPASTTTAVARCPADTAPAGGGIATTLVGGGTPPSSLHADGASPAAIDGRPLLASGSAAAGWSARGATGGQIVLGGVTTAYAVCLGNPRLGRTSAVVATVPGPAVAATTVRATASCPVGQQLLGGGGLTGVTGGSASPSLHLIGSYPSDAGGNAVADGSGDPAAWSAIADAGGRTGAGVQTSAFAICRATPVGHTVVARATRPGPLAAGGVSTATAACPPVAELVSGGALSGPPAGTPQQGLHLTGSFPSSPVGVGVGSAPAASDAESWTARAEAGGQGSPTGTATTAFALCLDS